MTTSNDRGLWVGFKSGNINVYQLYDKMVRSSSSCHADLTWSLNVAPTRLYAHEAEITVITICTVFSVAATGDKDGNIILWDYNK